MAAEAPEKIVFLGGAPRSGTTVTHALVCTSAAVSRYTPEISFFRGFTQAYRNGRFTWESHTNGFFDSLEAFRLHMRRSCEHSLAHVWRHLDRPRILALKDPLLTPYFKDLRELFPDLASFISVVRSPFDVVRSRQEVHERSGTGRPFSPSDAAEVAREYMGSYRAVLGTDFGGRHFAFRYEDLNDPGVQAKLAAFVGVDDFFARPMWGDTEAPADDPWASPKYNQAIDLTPRLSPLSDPLKAATRAICAPLMERFGYG